MFGYVLPVQKQLSNEEYSLYNSFYCGICLDIKERLGEFARFATGYDMTFFAVLLSDIVDQDIDFFTCKCIGSPFQKHAVVKRNVLMDKVADLSVILAYYKTQDNVADGEVIKGKLAAKMFRKAYNKAKENSPELDSIVDINLKELEKLQSDSDISIDRLAHPFGNLIKQAAISIIGDKTNDNIERLCYNIGKFVYLIDALDDLVEDIKKGTFNAFLHTISNGSPSNFKGMTKTEFLAQHGSDIEFCINSTINMCITGFNSLDFRQSYSLLKNIIHLGLRDKLKQVLNSKGKLKKSQVGKDMRRTKAEAKLDLNKAKEQQATQ